MEEQGRAGSCARAVCVGRRPLAAREGLSWWSFAASIPLLRAPQKWLCLCPAFPHHPLSEPRLCASLPGLRLSRGDSGLDGAGAGLRARGRPWQQLRRGGEKGASPSCGKGTLGRQRGRETFSRKKLLQFPPYIPSCEWLSRGLSAGLASPSASPPAAADTRRKWENNRENFSKTLLTSLPLQPVPPCLRLEAKKGVQRTHANTSPGVV